MKDSNITESEQVTRAYIDRIEEVEIGEDKAVLYTDSDEPEKFVLPKSMLPVDAGVDDYVLVKIVKSDDSEDEQIGE